MDLLAWLFLLNASLLIVHEMDSAYWKEWDLFHLPGGLRFFLIIHIPLVGLILYGFAELNRGTRFGLFTSLFLAAAGVFAFCIHSFFLKRGRDEFRDPVSIGILVATFIVSLAQLALTINAF